MRASVTLLAAGGTIAARPDVAGRVRPVLSASDLLESTVVPSGVSVDAVDVERFPSWDIDLPAMLRMAQRAERSFGEGADGVVLTHGTDTLEETACFLDVACNTDGPVVVTGAMRHAGQPGADGPANLADALAVASCDDAAGLGCLVVLGGKVHAAARVRKAHSSAPDAFVSVGGPIAEVYADSRGERTIRILARPRRAPTLRVSTLDVSVPTIEVVAGMDAAIVQAMLSTEPDGLVVAGTGLGYLPTAWIPPIRAAAARIPVVLVTRTGAGPVALPRDTPGDGYARLIPAGFRTARRARIELACALAAGLVGDALRSWLVER
jgi:L-asparaginase